MKKIIAVNAGPRKGYNTDLLIRAAGKEVLLNETKGTMHGYDIVTKASVSLDSMEKRIAFIHAMMGNGNLGH